MAQLWRDEGKQNEASELLARPEAKALLEDLEA
jgi:hypothetical protein